MQEGIKIVLDREAMSTNTVSYDKRRLETRLVLEEGLHRAFRESPRVRNTEQLQEPRLGRR